MRKNLVLLDRNEKRHRNLLYGMYPIYLIKGLETVVFPKLLTTLCLGLGFS